MPTSVFSACRMRMAGMRAPGNPERRSARGIDANKAASDGSNLERDLVSRPRVRPQKRSRGKLHHLCRGRMDARCAERAKVGQGTDHLAIPVEEGSVDRERHEEGVDRVTRLDGESIAPGQVSAAEQAAHPFPDAGA